jgi:hypothetical protein
MASGLYTSFCPVCRRQGDRLIGYCTAYNFLDLEVDPAICETYLRLNWQYASLVKDSTRPIHDVSGRRSEGRTKCMRVSPCAKSMKLWKCMIETSTESHLLPVGYTHYLKTSVHSDGSTYYWYAVEEEDEFCNQHLDVENESCAEFTPHLLPARYFLHVNAGAISET